SSRALEIWTDKISYWLFWQLQVALPIRLYRFRNCSFCWTKEFQHTQAARISPSGLTTTGLSIQTCIRFSKLYRREAWLPLMPSLICAARHIVQRRTGNHTANIFSRVLTGAHRPTSVICPLGFAVCPLDSSFQRFTRNFRQ